MISRDTSDSSEPRVTLNKAAWRATAITCVVVLLGLVAALLAQAGLWSSSSAPHPEPLTTLALVLAILAFLVQLFVFVFQNNASSRAIQRSEELNSKTHSVLDKIEANSAATQQVLFAQFDRLLNYIVGPQVPGVRAQSDTEAADDENEAADDSDGHTDDQEQPLTLTAASFRAIMEETMAQNTRPTFSTVRPEPSKDDLRIVEFLSSWPDRQEAEEIVNGLAKLSPLALVSLTRLAGAEITRRSQGQRPGLHITQSAPDPMGRELVAARLVRPLDGRMLLTDEGQRLARMLPTGRGKSAPVWLEDVVQPLLNRPAPN